MQSVLSNAKAVLNNLHATQSDIDSVTTELLNSINALEPATGGGEETWPKPERQ